MREEAESAGSSKRREGDDRLMGEKDPPPYGAQQRQDALWEGGNEALPPQWQLFEEGGNVVYQDDDLMIGTWKRPLPGVRLDYPGQIVVSGCEWHISPQGRSYFVNHNIRTTSWKDGAYIFSGSSDATIRKWQLNDGKEVFVLRGHTNAVRSICVSPHQHHLVSASNDYSVRIWNLETNQQVGDPLLHDDRLFTVVLCSDGRYIASAGLAKKIYVWSLQAALKQAGDQPDAKLRERATSPRDVFHFSPPSKQQVSNQGLSRYGDDFWGNDTNRTPHHSETLIRPSPPHRRNFFDFLRFTPSLIVPPTSTRSQRPPEPAIAQSYSTTSSAITPRLILSKWWPIHKPHVLPPVVDVPLTRGDQRNATAGAPKGNGGYRRDEDFDLPPPAANRNTDSQEPSAVTQTNTGEHGSGRFCFCL